VGGPAYASRSHLSATGYPLLAGIVERTVGGNRQRDENVTSFLIVHGWQNRHPEGHWQKWLARELRAQGHQVCYPQLPNPDHPRVAEWLAALRDQLVQMRYHERVVICHSLGAMAWLHLAHGGGPHSPVDRLLFVAPPSAGYLATEPALAAFEPPEPVGDLVRASSRTEPRLVCSDNDPCCKEGANRAYPTGFDVTMIRGAGHIDIDAGYGAWPSLLAWCSDPTVQITVGPGQRSRPPGTNGAVAALSTPSTVRAGVRRGRPARVVDAEPSG
jgi:predicted alpha/beta hydrolase family esterase